MCRDYTVHLVKCVKIVQCLPFNMYQGCRVYPIDFVSRLYCVFCEIHLWIVNKYMYRLCSISHEISVQFVECTSWNMCVGSMPSKHWELDNNVEILQMSYTNASLDKNYHILICIIQQSVSKHSIGIVSCYGFAQAGYNYLNLWW